MTTVTSIDRSESKDGASVASRLRRQARGRWVPGAGLLILAFALLVLGAILMAANQTRLRDSLHWVDHTQQVLRAAANLDIALVDVESGARAYLLTNDQQYLDNYHNARQVADDTMQSLTGLEYDNPNQL